MTPAENIKKDSRPDLYKMKSPHHLYIEQQTVSYSLLSIIERDKLELIDQHGTITIARQLGSYHATLSLKIRRNTKQKSYEADAPSELLQASVPNGKGNEE